MENEMLTLLKTRRSIRKYRPDPVEEPAPSESNHTCAEDGACLLTVMMQAAHKV